MSYHLIVCFGSYAWSSWQLPFPIVVGQCFLGMFNLLVVFGWLFILFCSLVYAVSISKAAILGIALGALVILLMILIAACRPHNPTPFPDGSLDKPVTYSRPKLVILHMNMALHVYEDIMRVTENLSEKYIIGSGASSTVYKCVLKNCRPVAIKRLYSHYPQCLKEFETELETIGSIKHRNLVSLQGYSLSPSRNLLFYDYMENGSLWDLLHGKFVSKNKPVPCVRICFGVSLASLYAHLRVMNYKFVLFLQFLPRRKFSVGPFDWRLHWERFWHC